MEAKSLIYQFDDVSVDLERFEAIKADSRVRLEPKAFAALVFLIENRGRLVEKKELLDAVWKDTAVTENAMTRIIAQLRKALGDDTKEAKYIETVPTRGYRFIARVKDLAEPGNEKLIQLKIARIAEATSSTVRQPPNETPRWLSKQVLVAGFVLAVILASASYLFINRQREASASKSLRSIAVLPFKSVGKETSDEYLGLQIADALITRLSGTKQIVVRPTATVRKYADPNQDPMIAGRELSVDLILDGSTTRLDDRIRVNVRLLKVMDGSAVFAQKYDEKFDGIFSIQDSIAAQAAAAMGLKLTSDETRLLRHHHTENTAAYSLYMNGRYFFDKDTVEG